MLVCVSTACIPLTNNVDTYTSRPHVNTLTTVQNPISGLLRFVFPLLFCSMFSLSLSPPPLPPLPLSLPLSFECAFPLCAVVAFTFSSITVITGLKQTKKHRLKITFFFLLSLQCDQQWHCINDFFLCVCLCSTRIWMNCTVLFHQLFLLLVCVIFGWR